MEEGGTGGERIAVLSDVHGNLTAFRAVLDDIAGRGIRTVVNLGDTVGKGPRGSDCVALARRACTSTVRGNWDDWLGVEPLRLPSGLDAEGRSGVQWWHDELTPDDRAWLSELPFSSSLVLGGTRIRFVHASATSVWTRVWQQHTAHEVDRLFGASELIEPGPAPGLVCYGDLHTAYVERTPHGLLVNVGSVGNPLDEPRAAYVVLDAGGDGVDVRFERVEYDVEAELAVAAQAGMPQYDAWAQELREARYRGRTD